MTTDAGLRVDPTTGLYDFSLDEKGDIETADFFDTSVLYSLFGERRANKDEVVDARLRRGWIGNEGQDFENGSKLWLFTQARLTATNLSRIRDEAGKGVQWLVDDQHVVSIVTEDPIIDLKNNKLTLILLIKTSKDKVERRFFDFWLNTGIR